MRRTRVLMMTVFTILGLIAPISVNAAPNQWTGTGPFATGLGNRVISALAVSADGTAVYSGTGSGTVFNYSVTAPTAATTAATGVGDSGATLNGTVNANDAATTVTFEYGTTTTYGSTVAGSPATVTGTSDTTVSANITGLIPGAIYHFRVKAVSSSGTSYGLDQTFTLNKAATTTTISSSVNPSTFGQSVTLTATVTGVTVFPTGTVTFMEGSTTLGTATLGAGGQATFATSSLGAGTHTITAIYGGDASYNTSTSSTLSQTVNQSSSTTTLASSPNPSTFGQSVAFTATVPGGATGTVTFTDGGATIGTGSLNGSGQATYSTSALTAGAHSITAVYGGDTNFNTSTSSAVSQTVNQASSTTGLGSSSNPSALGQQVTFTATVPSGATGTVNFKNAGTSITGCSAVAVTGSTATCATSALATGAHAITASYSGDSNYTGSTSTALTQTVSLAPAFTKGATDSTIFTMGSAGSYTVTAGGYPAPTFSITSGTLPSGVDLNVTTGEISGTPAAGTHGDHVITITASNGVLPNATQNFTLTVAFNASPPDLTVSTLPDGAVTTGKVLNISGTATGANGIQSVTINGTPVPFLSDGSFSFPFQLAVGGNTVAIVATDNAGRQVSDTRTITLTPTAPSLAVTSPADGITTYQTSIEVKGTSSAATVEARVNGGAALPAIKTVNDFTANVNLAAGMNTIVVTATDAGSNTSSAKLTIFSNPAAPDLAVTSPANDLVTSERTFTLSGTATSSTAPPVTVSIALDGQTYSPAVATGGAFQQQLTLSAEKNYNIVVTATDTGSNTATVQRNVIYSLIASGDMNGDGTVDIVDALFSMRASVNLVTPTADQLLRCDVAPLVNGVSEPDGKIDIQDAILILRKAVGLGW